MEIAKQLIELLRANNWRISVAESCTGGGLGAALTSIPGSSAVFMGGVIAYDNAVKSSLLGVQHSSLEAHGAVSEQVAREMAGGACALLKTDFAIAITGIAGPGGSETKPEGLVCFGLATPWGIKCERREFGALGRENVRAGAIRVALELAHLDISSQTA